MESKTGVAVADETAVVSDTQAVIDVVRDVGRVEVIQLADDRVVLSVPHGRTIQSVRPLLDEYRVRPERKQGFVRLTTVDSFVEYVQRHKGYGDAVIFCDERDPSRPLLRAVFDAHERSTPELRGAADWQGFGALYEFPRAAEWIAWTSLSKEYSQSEFAAFLEDRIGDVVEPGESVRAYAASIGAQLAGAARLLELSRGLSVHVGGKVAQSVDLGTGEKSIQFEESHKDASGAPIKVPGAFAIGIPVFRLGALYQLPVRLRYRVQSGTVWWSLAVQRADRALDLAIGEAAARVQTETGLPLYRGGQ